MALVQGQIPIYVKHATVTISSGIVNVFIKIAVFQFQIVKIVMEQTQTIARIVL